MLTPQTLRIGNLLRWKQSGKVVRVTGVSEYGGIITEGALRPRWKLEPIPITREWLERMGFERNVADEGSPCEVIYYTLRLSNEVYCNLTLMSGDKNGYPEVCLFPYESFFRYRYVHEVQNLYYAILGKELTISEPCP